MKINFYFMSCIFMAHFVIVIGILSELECKVAEILDHDCVGSFSKRCCGWNSNTGRLDYKCCPTQVDCPNGFDTYTCTIPTCFEIFVEVGCDKDYFMSEAKDEFSFPEKVFPAGADGVRECCRISEGKKLRAECCINVGQKTKCDPKYQTNGCASAPWEEHELT